MKRETGANPVRTRHRNQGAKPIYHWETGKMADAMIFKPGDLPDCCTEAEKNVKNAKRHLAKGKTSIEGFVNVYMRWNRKCFRPRVIGCTSQIAGSLTGLSVFGVYNPFYLNRKKGLFSLCLKCRRKAFSRSFLIERKAMKLQL